MTVQPVLQLDVYGPQRCDTLTAEEARQWCRRLVGGRYENFSVLSCFVPRERRDDFAAVYAFCRWADDLGDEVDDGDRSLELLAWWRRELERCYEGSVQHPVFVALAPVIDRCELPRRLFEDLIAAFERDQRQTRYETWDEVLDYCRQSANPVGRLVLGVLGEKTDDRILAGSDAICTALQLTNHWQDMGRDLLERDRIYAPKELITIDDFEPRFRASAAQGYAVDHAFLDESRGLVRTLVERTWPLYERGDEMLPRLSATARPIVTLLAAGGQRVLRLIELWNYETALHRPRLSAASKLRLVAGVWLNARFGRRDKAPSP